MKKRSISRLLPLAAGCLALVWSGGCGEKSPEPENVLARVEDSSITLEDFRREWVNQPVPPPGSPPESVEGFVDDMIAERLFLLEARRRKIDQDEVLLKEVEKYREQLMVETLLGREVLAVPEPSPDEIDKFWAGNREFFTLPQLTRLSHILVRAGEGEDEEAVVERCRAIKSRLDGGEEFEAVAREVSEGSSASRGGDLGYFREDQVIPEFRLVAGELESGKVSEPIRTEYGYHLLTVTDIKPPREKSLEESREEIAAIILAQRRKARFDQVKSGIASTISIWKNRELIERLRAEQQAALAPSGDAGFGAR